MKIILSPTKTMKRVDYNISKASKPYFYNESEKLFNILKSYSLEKIKFDFKVSDKLALSTFEYFQNRKNAVCALNLYDGLVFKNLKVNELSEDEIGFLIKHVRVLSTLYGVLSLSDLISEYRLDYLMPFEFDLYDFWYDKISEYFKNEDVIINLASLEFSKSFNHPNVINIHFLNEKLKAQSTNVKIARGDMLNYIVVNKISEPELLVNYSNLDYRFKEEMSDKNNYYFIKG